MVWFLSRLFRVPAVLVVIVLLVGIFVLNVAATGDSASIANALAAAAVLLSPLALKYVKLDGPTMLAVSYLASLLIAAAALFISGEAKFDFSSSASVLAFATGLFGLQQIVYAALTQHPKTTPLVQ